jgi:hypothetical protein
MADPMRHLDPIGTGGSPKPEPFPDHSRDYLDGYRDALEAAAKACDAAAAEAYQRVLTARDNAHKEAFNRDGEMAEELAEAIRALPVPR